MAKSKLTPELQKKFCDAIENGDSILGACGYVGIDESTYYKWMKKVRQGKERAGNVKFRGGSLTCCQNSNTKTRNLQFSFDP